jgi:hypothetical protein
MPLGRIRQSCSFKIKNALTSTFAVELRGLEPLTSSMPWWLRRSKRRAARVDVVPGRAGDATSIQTGSPSVCPARLEPPAVREPGPCRAEPIDLGLGQASVRVHAGSRGASQTVGCSPSSLAVPTHPVGLAPRNGSRLLPYQVGRNRGRWRRHSGRSSADVHPELRPLGPYSPGQYPCRIWAAELVAGSVTRRC